MTTLAQRLFADLTPSHDGNALWREVTVEGVQGIIDAAIPASSATEGVLRYGYHVSGVMEPLEDGSWVRLEDYLALRASPPNAEPAPVVRVKPLEWLPLAEYGADAEQASGILSGLYAVFLDEDSAAGAIFSEWAETSSALCTTAAKSLGRFYSWDEAKAACFDDFDTRIRSTLSLPVEGAAKEPVGEDAVIVTDGMVERLANQAAHVRLGIAARYPDITDATKELLDQVDALTAALSLPVEGAAKEGVR